MTNVTVQEAFDKWIEKHKKHFPQGISAMDKNMFASGYEAALSDIEKCEPVGGLVLTDGRKLRKDIYTSPQLKEFVGLSDEQILELDWNTPTQLARVVEAKLKQLNSNV